MEKEIKVFSSDTLGVIQNEINMFSDIIIYDSIKITCNSVDNSASGVVFILIYKIN